MESISRGYHDTLGVRRDSTEDQVKEAYRKLALDWHPDKNLERLAEKNSKRLAEAYEVPLDPRKRQVYDRYGKERLFNGAPECPSAHNLEVSNMDGLFGQFGVGGGMFHSNPRDSNDVFKQCLSDDPFAGSSNQAYNCKTVPGSNSENKHGKTTRYGAFFYAFS